jgi:uncharacterized protein YkwD
MKQKKYLQPLGLSFGEKIIAGILILPLAWNLSNMVLSRPAVFADDAVAPAARQVNCPEVMAFGNQAQIIKKVFDLTNQDRQKNNLPKLCYSQALARAAQGKADDMAAQEYFAHINPQGEDMKYWIFKNGGDEYFKIGENLAVNFWDAGVLENAWMNSPEHKANVLNGGYQDVGIGMASGRYDGYNTQFFSVMFGGS